MAAITIACKALILPTPPPLITIPNFGILQKAYEFLDGVPDPMDVMLKMQDLMAAMLAPVRRFLELVESIMAIHQCMITIPKAISRLSPAPIFECMKALAKAIARLLSFVPPMAYIRTACDLCAYCIDLIDAILSFFESVDAKVTAWLNILNGAQLLGDLDLIEFINCGMGEVKLAVKLTTDILRSVQPLNQLFLDVFIRLIPSEQLQKQAERLTKLQDYYADVSAAVVAGSAVLPALPDDLVPPPSNTVDPGLGIPPLSPLFEAMNQTRNVMVILYNLLSVTVGLDANKETRETPTYTNF